MVATTPRASSAMQVEYFLSSEPVAIDKTVQTRKTGLIQPPTKHAHGHAFARTTLLGVVLLLAAGCDWRSPQTPVAKDGGLELTSLAEGVEGWNTRQDDKGRVPGLDTIREDSALWLTVKAARGAASRWRRKVRWSAEEFPFLEWEWTPDRKVDSIRFPRRNAPATVLAVDVTLASSFGIHKTIRYVWSARQDRKIHYQRDAWHPKVVVLRDATDPVARPLGERVNVWQDFRRLWGATPRHQALSISVIAHDPDTSKVLVARFGEIVAQPSKDRP